MTERMRIGRREIGVGCPAYIVAELSANHSQDFERAAALVRAAKEAGADAVKLQTFTADTLTLCSSAEPFRISGGTPWDHRTLHDLYREASMPWEWQPRLKRVAEDLGMDLFSTAFDPSSVDFLEAMAVPAHKIASFEIVDLPLIERVARTGKPLLISTGMATLDEIEEAVAAARRAGAGGVVLLKCTSAYPAPPDEVNLRTIPDLTRVFGVPVGLSDHSLCDSVAVAAVALGACVVEKHFTLSRKDPGPDSAFSLEPREFRAMVEAVRTAEKALGAVRYGPGPQEEKSLLFRRSLFAVEDVAAGEELTPRNVRSVRPGHGLHPRHASEIIGRRASRDIARGTPLGWDLIRREGQTA